MEVIELGHYIVKSGAGGRGATATGGGGATASSHSSLLACTVCDVTVHVMSSSDSWGGVISDLHGPKSQYSNYHC